jgi:hypothetical protein
VSSRYEMTHLADASNCAGQLRNALVNEDCFADEWWRGESLTLTRRELSIRPSRDAVSE